MTCAVEVLVRKDRCAARPEHGAGRRRSNLEDAFYTVHTRHFPDIRYDRLQLAAIGYFQAGGDARVRTVGAAFQAVDVRAGAADDRRNFSQKSRAIARANHEL